VAGAFHTTHMAPAIPALQALAQQMTASDPTVTVLSNADGAPVASGAELLARLVSQVGNPVRWDLCMQAMADLGVTGLIELPPAGTLVGLAKRGLPGVQTLALKTPDDLEAAQSMIREHAASGAAALSPDAKA
jgi:[acyl-carrier-protein] S-malonyltransferase